MALVHQSETEQCLLVAAGMLMNYSLIGSLADVSQSINWKCTYIHICIYIKYMYILYICMYIYIGCNFLQFTEHYLNKNC